MKIINLIIYNSSQEYDEMRDKLRIYLKDIKNSTKNLTKNLTKDDINRYPNIEYFSYYFITLDENIPIGEYKLIDDDIIIFGGEKDSIYPGCLLKTIMAFIAIHNSGIEYNYMVRSNISTVIDFNKLAENINNLNSSVNKKYDYIGGLLLEISWIDLNYGVTEKYKGIKYMQGTCIILSQKAVNYIVHNKDKIDYNVVDDVAIGKFIGENSDKLVNDFAVIPNSFIVNQENCNDTNIIYRNRNSDRNIDIHNISNIINCIMKK